MCALEIPARFDHVTENLALVDALLSNVRADIVLLPEASLTGYVSSAGDFDLTRFAEPRAGATSNALAALAKKHRTHLVGPLIERDGKYVYNAMIGFDANGVEMIHYRKRHPWFPETWATPGDAPHPIARIGGLSVTLAICFDIHFGEIPAADVVLFASAWVDERDDDGVREALLAKLGTHVVNANWGAGEPRVPGQGNSCILHASGERVRANAHGVVSGTVRLPDRRPR